MEEVDVVWGEGVAAEWAEWVVLRLPGLVVSASVPTAATGCPIR